MPSSVIADVDIRTKSYPTAQGPRLVLSGLRFHVRRGELLAVLGPSGCGKTTLLRILAGLDTDYEGSVRFADMPVRGPSRERPLMFQEARLLPWLSVGANVRFAMQSGVARRAKKAAVNHALARVGLREYHDASPTELSGGMAKRVALARALVNSPPLLLMDEPFAGADVSTRYALHDHVAAIHAEQPGPTVLLVTHDLEEAVYLSDRILVLTPTQVRVKSEILIDLPRPRNRQDPAFRELCATVLRVSLEAWTSADNNL